MRYRYQTSHATVAVHDDGTIHLRAPRAPATGPPPDGLLVARDRAELDQLIHALEDAWFSAGHDDDGVADG